ncbi:short-chain dehydrogenase/reductase SDR [Planococcus antarcticus DSM 14505]|uniref:NAD(P)-dependent oxidoreductase n=1 Tax=Planococcus antarcticus DSM 14505 TaxID=1185653 RepID=A0A1C7DEG0_9BACL|nr:SDR family oxidoreductase [Planococcus antarcticus]ANU09844.1 NAD(P)-dependent oxidoreductase [Planococcus antarcticus DSM 14505]EIM07551.1 short-chain dehydrogenase/reductase SDR [Planococcus antarcticus DSM 14505]
MTKDKFEKIDEQVDPQEQSTQPGSEEKMNPEPIYDDEDYTGSGKLEGKVALITGGDSGIGRAVAVAYAKEGASIAIAYLDEHEDAEETIKAIESYGAKGVKFATDISDVENCNQLVVDVISEFGQLNVLVNNAGKQFPQDDFLAISPDQLMETFSTNIFSMFYLTQAALPHFQKGDSIINTSSVTAYRGSAELIDYSSTKGAITSFTRSLSANIAEQGIRVNSVAPGPIWTPLIPATFGSEKVGEHGGETPMERRGQPSELAPAYVYLASKDATYVTGQAIHVNGGGFISS